MRWLGHIIIGFIVFAAPCNGNEPLTFVGVDMVYPFAYSKNGEIKGYDCDIFREAMKRAGIAVTLELLPFKRAWAYVKEGEVDGIFMLYFTEARREYVRYCDVPVHVGTFHLFVKTGHEFPFQTIRDLYGKRVGNLLGFSVTPEFHQAVMEKKIFLEEASSLEMNLKKLLAGRMDCFISSVRLLRPLFKDSAMENTIVPLPTPILPERKVMMAVSRKSKNIRDIDAFLRTFATIRNQMDRDGTIERIDNLYFPAQ